MKAKPLQLRIRSVSKSVSAPPPSHRMKMASRKKTIASNCILPVKTLKDHIVSLDAAMLVAATAAEIGAVHKLRTTTRRVEAYLRLVDLLEHATRPKDIPEHAAEAKAVQSRLRKVRRAAGVVRDLDVQADAVWYDAPAKTAIKGSESIAAVRQEAKALRKHLTKTRSMEAANLIAILHAQQQKLAAALRALEQAMKPASGPAIDPAEMAVRVQQWFATETQKLLFPDRNDKNAGLSFRTNLERLDEESLHRLRKAAKLCRYMAESAPENSPVRALAQQFETVQEVGGQWHDWLLLTKLARGFHGRKADLTKRYAQRSREALATYHRTLEEQLPLLTTGFQR